MKSKSQNPNSGISEGELGSGSEIVWTVAMLVIFNGDIILVWMKTRSQVACGDQGCGPDAGKTDWPGLGGLIDFQPSKYIQGRAGPLHKAELVSKAHCYQLNFYVIHVKGCYLSLSGRIDGRREKQHLNIAMFVLFNILMGRDWAGRLNMLTAYVWAWVCKNRVCDNQCLAIESREVPWLYWPISSFRPFHARLSEHCLEMMQLSYFRDQTLDMELICLIRVSMTWEMVGHWPLGFHVILHTFPSLLYVTQILLQWVLLTQLFGVLLADNLLLSDTSGIN